MLALEAGGRRCDYGCPFISIAKDSMKMHCKIP